MVKSYKPDFRQPEKELSNKIDVKVDARLASILEKIRLELETKTDEKIRLVLLEKEEKTKKEKEKEKADKLIDAVNNARSIKDDKDNKDKEKVITVEQDSHGHDDVLCPTCKGHIHKVETDKSGLVYRCLGDKCGFEAILVDKKSDFKCNNCGAPVKKPEKPEEMDGCPFCKGTKAVRHNWGKLWGVADKQKA